MLLDSSFPIVGRVNIVCLFALLAAVWYGIGTRYEDDYVFRLHRCASDPCPMSCIDSMIDPSLACSNVSAYKTF